MYFAGYIVGGLPRRRRLRGRLAARAPRPLPPHRARGRARASPALAAPVQVLVGDWAGRAVAEQPAGQARRVRGPAAARRTGAPFTVGGYYDADAGEVNYGIEIPKLLSLLATTTRTAAWSGSTRCRPTTARRSTSCASRSRRWSASAPPSRCSASLFFVTRCAAGAGCRARAWFYRAVMAAGPLSLVALIAGWITTEVGRQPWIVYRSCARSRR